MTGCSDGRRCFRAGPAGTVLLLCLSAMEKLTDEFLDTNKLSENL